MTFLKAHYDGNYLVLDEAADLKPGQKVIVLRMNWRTIPTREGR